MRSGFKIIFLPLFLILLTPSIVNGEESDNPWYQYLESYKQYMEDYKEWAHSTIELYKTEWTKSTQTITYLENKIHKLEQENAQQKVKITEISDWALSVEKYLDESDSYYEGLKNKNELELDSLKQYANELDEQYRITIHDGHINWTFKDVSNNKYNWQLPIESFESTVKYNTDYDVRGLSNPDIGESYNVPKLSPFVQQSFSNVIEQVWDNSDGDLKFVGNVWFIVNQLTTYSSDIGEYPRYATETLGRGGGDCEDLAILIANMILSSTHTQDWELEFIIMDSNNPENPQTVNHVILLIDDGTNRYYIEPTSTDALTMLMWNSYSIVGWNEEIIV